MIRRIKLKFGKCGDKTELYHKKTLQSNPFGKDCSSFFFGGVQPSEFDLFTKPQGRYSPNDRIHHIRKFVSKPVESGISS